MAARTALAGLTTFLGSSGDPTLNLDHLSRALAEVRPSWDLRIQEILHFLRLLGVDPRADATFVTRRTTYRGEPGFLFLYRHPTRDVVTVFALPDGAPVPQVFAYRCDLDFVKARLAEILTPVSGTGPGEIDFRTPMSHEAYYRANFLTFNLEAVGLDALQNPFRRPDGLLPLLERHLRLREAIEAVLAE